MNGSIVLNKNGGIHFTINDRRRVPEIDWNLWSALPDGDIKKTDHGKPNIQQRHAARLEADLGCVGAAPRCAMHTEQTQQLAMLRMHSWIVAQLSLFRLTGQSSNPLQWAGVDCRQYPVRAMHHSLR